MGRSEFSFNVSILLEREPNRESPERVLEVWAPTSLSSLPPCSETRAEEQRVAGMTGLLHLVHGEPTAGLGHAAQARDLKESVRSPFPVELRQPQGKGRKKGRG